MVGMQDEDAPHGARQHGIDLVFLARHREAHMQEVGRVLELVPRINERLPDRIFVGHRGDGRHLGDHAHARHLALFGILDVDRVVIEGGERADHAHHDRHGMRVTPEAGVEPGHLLMHHGVHGDAMGEILVLRFRRQLAIEQQVAGLEEGAVLGELVDRIAAIEQDALVTVDEGDLRLAARRRGEAGVVSEAAGILIERVDVDHIGPKRALADRQIVSRAVDQDRCLGGGRRAELLCDAHLKAPLDHPEGDGSPSERSTIASLANAFIALPHNRAERAAVQQLLLLKC